MKKLKGLIFTSFIILPFLGFLHYYQIERTIRIQEAVGNAHYENHAYEKAITAYEKIKKYKNDDFAFNLMLTKLYVEVYNETESTDAMRRVAEQIEKAYALNTTNLEIIALRKDYLIRDP